MKTTGDNILLTKDDLMEGEEFPPECNSFKLVYRGDDGQRYCINWEMKQEEFKCM